MALIIVSASTMSFRQLFSRNLCSEYHITGFPIETFGNDKSALGATRKKGIREYSPAPMTSECQLCHTQTPSYNSSAQPFGLDRSLHYRHEITEAIRSTAPGESKTDDKDWNCGVCHHEYDNKQKWFRKNGSGS